MNRRHLFTVSMILLHIARSAAAAPPEMLGLSKPNLIAVIDVADHDITDKFPLTLSDAGSPIAQDAENGLLCVGCPKQKPMIVVFDTKAGKEVASVEIPAVIDDLHFDSRR